MDKILRFTLPKFSLVTYFYPKNIKWNVGVEGIVMLEHFLYPVIVGVLSSFIASFIFISFLTKVRPKLEISDQIAKEKSFEVDLLHEPMHQIESKE